jgi:Na+/melibiose symporter-like transporter
MSAAGLALILFGVLQSSSWGWVSPKVAEGPESTPAIAGISLTIWLILAGALLLRGLMRWLEHRVAAGDEPLFAPDLLENRQLRGGLVMLMIQFVMSNGLFFMIPLYLSIVLGLSSFETGLRMLPLSIALMIVAPAIPKFAPTASPRHVVRAGLLLVAAGLLLAGLRDLGSGPEIVFVPFLLVGAALGMFASQLGNVIVCAEPVERSSEVGGLQYTTENLGASFGTALIGAIVIGGLTTHVVDELALDPSVDTEFVQDVGVELESGADFDSSEDLEEALAATDLSEAERVAIVDANAAPRITSLQWGSIAIALFALLGLYASRNIPNRALDPTA